MHIHKIQEPFWVNPNSPTFNDRIQQTKSLFKLVVAKFQVNFHPGTSLSSVPDLNSLNASKHFIFSEKTISASLSLLYIKPINKYPIIYFLSYIIYTYMMATMIAETSLLNKLKRAIQKVKFLLSFNPTRWVVSSFRGSFTLRKISFNAQPSLLDCTIDSTPVDLHRWGSISSSVSRTTSNASQVSRTISNASSIDDIDKKAEIFIANFYKHIQLERQVSLDLRYCSQNSLERIESI